MLQPHDHDPVTELHRRAERAGEQVMLALRITSEKLNAARAKVLRLDALENEDAPEKALEKGN